MAERCNSLSVMLAKDVHGYDAEAIINAIKMVKGVLLVRPCVSDEADYMAKQKIRNKLIENVSKRTWKMQYPEGGFGKD